MAVILLREVLLEMGISFKSSDSKQKLIDKVIHARSSVNITRPVNGMANSANELVHMHAQETSVNIAHAHGVKSASIDFVLKRKMVLLVHLLFLSSLLTANIPLM